MKKIYPVILLALLLGFDSAKATKWIITSQSTPTEGFLPAVVNNVVCGDTINWKNTNGVHTTASTSIPVGATPWSSGNISPNPGYIYIPTVVGTYNYTCHPSTPHMPASFIVTSCPSSVPVYDISHVSFVYPNPFTTSVTIEAENIDLIAVFNILGENVKSIQVLNGQTKVNISTAELNNGIYLFAIMSKGVVVETRKLVKN